MKFCPNCGTILEGKLKCDCGYDILTGEVDEKIYEDFKNNEKVLYKQSCHFLSAGNKKSSFFLPYNYLFVKIKLFRTLNIFTCFFYT